MRLFLYEFITGGGLLPTQTCLEPGVDEWPSSLLAEGRAMISALAADALAIPGVEIRLLWDARLALPKLPAECVQVVADQARAEQHLAKLAAESDGTILIAPESDGILASRARDVLAAGGRLLSADPELIALCTDKQRTAEHLHAAGVPTPRGMRIAPAAKLPPEFPFPAVLKPVDGCGSQAVRWLSTWSEGLNHLTTPGRLEEFCPGEAASVAVLCGGAARVARPELPVNRVVSGDSPRPSKAQGRATPDHEAVAPVGNLFTPMLLPLPTCRQLLAGDGSFAYRGGSLPVPEEFNNRAQSLALRAVASLPNPHGYIGVDLVLGAAADGSQDFVIEINPRLTTSYVGLRRATSDNLLAAWLQMAAGKTVSLKFSTAPIQFRADGQVIK